ncbi:MAG TPA: DUF3015 family protein, partial [bacterium]
MLSRLASHLVLAAALLPLIASMNALGQPKCPEVSDVYGRKAFNETPFFVVTTGWTTFPTTVFGAHISGTSGCGGSKTSSRQADTHMFVAVMGADLIREIAQGQG